MIADILTSKYNFELKCTGPISYYLGCDFTRDGNNELALSPWNRIGNMSHSHVSIFGSKLKSSFYSPVEKVDHLELENKNLFRC